MTPHPTTFQTEAEQLDVAAFRHEADHLRRRFGLSDEQAQHMVQLAFERLGPVAPAGDGLSVSRA